MPLIPRLRKYGQNSGCLWQGKQSFGQRQTPKAAVQSKGSLRGILFCFFFFFLNPKLMERSYLSQAQGSAAPLHWWIWCFPSLGNAGAQGRSDLQHSLQLGEFLKTPMEGKGTEGTQQGQGEEPRHRRVPSGAPGERMSRSALTPCGRSPHLSTEQRRNVPKNVTSSRAGDGPGPAPLPASCLQPCTLKTSWVWEFRCF